MVHGKVDNGGSNNFTLTSKNWFSGLWIGDKIKVQIIKEGIIKYSNKPFIDEDIILPNTEMNALSCNSLWNDKLYSFYMTDNPMPQYATDTLFLWSSPKDLLIKILKRNSGDNIDFPEKIIPAGGEHLQPDKFWMLKDHQNFIPSSINKISNFLTLTENEQELFKF